MLWGLQGCAGCGLWAVESGFSSWWLSHRDCCGPHLLLPGGCLPQPAWRQEAAADPWLPVSAEMTALPTPPQMVPYPMGEPLLAEAQRGPLPTGSCYWMPQRRTPITCPSPRSSQDLCSSDPTQGQGQPQGPIFPASGRPAFPPQPRLVAQLPVLEAGPCPGPTRINNDLYPLHTQHWPSCLGRPHLSMQGRCCWPSPRATNRA